MTEPARSEGRWGGRVRLQTATAIALGITAAFIAWVLIGRDDDQTATTAPIAETQPTRSGARAATPADVEALASSVGHPVYWLGRRRGQTIELTHTPDGRIYVRYLPRGVRPGDPRPNFITVGTYPYENAVDAIRAVAEDSGAPILRVRGGGVAVPVKGYPRSMHIAFPESDFQIEVYSPRPALTRRLVTSGTVRPVS